MEEMIDAQQELPQQIAKSGSVALLRRHLDETEAANEPITFCGCGTSEHAARAAAAVLHQAYPRVDITARDAFEVCLDPPTRGLLVGISHSAETSATLDALRHGQESGAQSALITAAPDLAPDGMTVIPTPLYDGSWCHTVAYTSPIITVALAAGMGQESLRSITQQALSYRLERTQDAEILLGCDRFLVVGSGVDEITASELALKIEEAAHVPCTPLGIEKILHGHLPAATARSGLILLRYDGSKLGQRDQRGEDVIAACDVLRMPRVTLRTQTHNVAEALLAGAIAAQLLTVEIATALGINPDLIRREDDLYRQVAEAAKAG
jgi:glucosamine 6-phosphate synthetase-like amidotransferase/phosphosugar isomerase protein